MRPRRSRRCGGLIQPPLYRPGRSGWEAGSRGRRRRCRIFWRTTLRTFEWGLFWAMWYSCPIRWSHYGEIWSFRVRVYSLACRAFSAWWVRTPPRRWCSWPAITESCFIIFGGCGSWFPLARLFCAGLILSLCECFLSSIWGPRCFSGCLHSTLVRRLTWTPGRLGFYQHSLFSSRLCSPSWPAGRSLFILQTSLAGCWSGWRCFWSALRLWLPSLLRSRSFAPPGPPCWPRLSSLPLNSSSPIPGVPVSVDCCWRRPLRQPCRCSWTGRTVLAPAAMILFGCHQFCHRGIPARLIVACAVVRECRVSSWSFPCLPECHAWQVLASTP